ncbi:glycosyltransferase family 4 protein [Listeria grandensis]|uniref:Glycosyltransferase family 4 protein n=1 Tax=Listeria grandensis TaxID=1494963 RepID=A0A7X0Y3G8_9LIST|nr:MULTISPECIES: glycosyltransferase family 4 protein [Listeria]MBC1474281.1 glycosyltransferase family 4 protein [Listeria grandensis]MBC1936331.1 glycosyltransferase family 4 protein [Listeria grandensis]MBC6129756.1 glycosyltransferase family 4 protein [Listeria booriae]MBC6164579.1 glycosyltransferase family 4 protein [Listeria booriae]
MTEKLNVLMVSDDFYPSVGGIAAHVLEISRAISSLGHNVVLLTKLYDPENNLPEEEYIDNVRVVRIKVSNRRKIRALEFMYKGRRKIKQLLRENTFQVIHWHKLIADSIITKIPFDGVKIFTNHSSTFLHWYEQKKFTRCRVLLGHMDGVIAPSSELTSKIADILPEKPARNISNGVDISKFFPSNVMRSNMRVKLGYSFDDKVVMIARRLEEKNGVLYFTKAIPKMVANDPTIQILIVGSGSQEVAIRTFIEENDLADRVTIMTGVMNPEMPHYFNAADVVVLPSLMEATSIAGLEAMACGKPLVGTNVGGIPEIIHPGQTGYLVPSKSSDALATGVLEMIADETQLYEMGDNALQSVYQNFAWQEIARKTVAFYRQNLKT